MNETKFGFIGFSISTLGIPLVVVCLAIIGAVCALVIMSSAYIMANGFDGLQTVAQMNILGRDFPSTILVLLTVGCPISSYAYYRLIRATGELAEKRHGWPRQVGSSWDISDVHSWSNMEYAVAVYAGVGLICACVGVGAYLIGSSVVSLAAMIGMAAFLFTQHGLVQWSAERYRSIDAGDAK